MRTVKKDISYVKNSVPVKEWMFLVKLLFNKLTEKKRAVQHRIVGVSDEKGTKIDPFSFSSLGEKYVI